MYLMYDLCVSDDKAQYFQHRIHCSQLGDPKVTFKC